jgi:phage terminase large subunit
MTKTIQLPREGWKPREYQMPMWNALVSGTKTVIANWARRHGKDELMLNWMAVAAMQRVGSYLHMMPEYSAVRRALWSGVNPRTGRTRVMDAFIPEIVAKIDDKGMMITLINGSTVQFVGSDTHSSFIGSSVVGVVMSEAALADPAAYALLRPILKESNGWFAAISTPRGRNWFYDLYETHRNNPTSFVSTVSAATSGVFTPEQLKEERHDYIQMYGATQGNSLYAQEYNVSFEAANIGSVFGSELAQLKASGRYGLCAYDPRYLVDTSCDLGISDATTYLFFQNVGSETRLIDVYEASDNGLEHYVQMLNEKKYKYGKHYAPHDAQHRELISGTSRISQAARLGLHWQVVPALPKQDQIALGCQLINRLIINSTPDLDTGAPACAYAMEALSNYQFKYDSVRKIMGRTPVHDWSSHLCDAFMLYAVAKAKDVGFIRPAEATTMQQERQYPRLSAIMRANNNRSTGLWG